MIRTNLTPNPVGQQPPPTRAAASPVWMALRDARRPLLLTAATVCIALDERGRR
jgi:hypothetical protein